MALEIEPLSAVSRAEIAALEARLRAFYENTPDKYYATADSAVGRYSPELLPFHCHLVAAIEEGATVCEVGCGTAHLCPEVLRKGARYTGLDWSEDLLSANRQRYPDAEFLRTDAVETRTFDVVASLYTIEHVPNVPAYLETLWRLCRPGGLAAIICPDFVNCAALPPSVFFGRTPRRLREKLRAGDLWDAGLHLWELKVGGPRWKRRARQAPPPQFQINLRPKVLEGTEYDIDADAVHLPRYEDLRWWFEREHGVVEACSRSLPGVPGEAFSHSLYLLVRKPF